MDNNNYLSTGHSTGDKAKKKSYIFLLLLLFSSVIHEPAPVRGMTEVQFSCNVHNFNKELKSSLCFTCS